MHIESSRMLEAHHRLGLSCDLIMLCDNSQYAKVLSLMVVVVLKVWLSTEVQKNLVITCSKINCMFKYMLLGYLMIIPMFLSHH